LESALTNSVNAENDCVTSYKAKKTNFVTIHCK